MGSAKWVQANNNSTKSLTMILSEYVGIWESSTLPAHYLVSAVEFLDSKKTIDSSSADYADSRRLGIMRQ
jgi:hypothetical protein